MPWSQQLNASTTQRCGQQQNVKCLDVTPGSVFKTGNKKIHDFLLS
jgi:hypothetical protein